MTNPRIRLIRPCEWEEIFLEWYKNEGNQANWRELAQKRGYAGWAEWRLKGYAERFACREAEWGFYEISDPVDVVTGWHGGPFSSWIERHYGGAKTRTFAELVQDPNISSHAGIRARAENYPAPSVITALELPNGKIFVIEGMHRACALALMSKEGTSAPEMLVFAIGRSKLSELPPSGRAD